MRFPFLFLASVGLLAAQNRPADIIHLDPVAVEAPAAPVPTGAVRFDLGAEPAVDNTLDTLAERAANFFVSSNGARSFTDVHALRGLANTPIFGPPAVTAYLDDLPLGPSFTFPTNLAGFTLADLLRGPGHATRYGAAGPGGILVLRTPEPGQSAGGELRADAGDHGARSVAASASTAAGGKIDAYASANWSERDGFIHNTTLDRDIDGQNGRSALVRLRTRPVAGTELTFLATALRARDGVQPLVPLGGPFFTVTRTAEGETDLDAFNAALTVARAMPLGRLTATAAVNSWELFPYSSTLAFRPGVELGNHVRQRQRTWHGEARLASDPAAPRAWLVGLYGNTGRTDGAFDRLFGPFPYERSSFRTDADTLAAFGEATFTVAPNLRLTAGLRAETVRRSLDRNELVPVPHRILLDHASAAWLPKLVLTWERDRTTTLFASLGAGWKPGGFSTFTGNQALAAFGPERTNALEAGATRTSAEGRLSTTVRAFWYDITGYQIERSFATSALTDDYLVVNAPRARSFGGELELKWHPADGLEVTAAIGETDVTLRKFTDPYTGVSYAGKHAPAVPGYDASLRIDYTQTQGDRHFGSTPRGWFVGGGVSGRGQVFYTEGEDPAFGQKPVWLLDAHVGYAGPRWRLTLYGRNLTDERYYSAITPGTGHGTPGAPRTSGVELTLRF